MEMPPWVGLLVSLVALPLLGFLFRIERRLYKIGLSLSQIEKLLTRCSRLLDQ